MPSSCAEREGGGDAAACLNAPAPNLAGFQHRAFAAIFNAWVGSGDERFVIAADTGSGKTEAACLPIIAGATLDLLRSIGGTRAILVYPDCRDDTIKALQVALNLGMDDGSSCTSFSYHVDR